VNPFTESRVTLASTSSPRSETRRTFPSQFESAIRGFNQTPFPSSEEVEKRIMLRYEKELYEVGESGHCLAETIIDAQIADI
jgi:hypothetical protein